MLADLKQAIHTPLGFAEFLQQCEFFNHLQSAVAVVDRNGDSHYENRGFASFSQHPDSNGSVMNHEILRRETVNDAVNACCTTQRAVELIENVTIDTTISYPVHLLLQPIIQDQADNVIGVFISIAEGSLDILRRRLSMHEKQQQDMLARIRELSTQSRSKELLIQSLFRDAPFSLMVMDADRRIVRMNRNCEKILGVKAGQVFGDRCDKYLSCHRDNDGCIACSEENTGAYLEGKLYNSDGEELDILKSSVPHTLEGDSFILEAFIDITERKRLSQLEKDKERDIREASARSKSAFYASLSHELRTPLNAIIGYSEILLEEDGLSSQANQDLENIKFSGDHLLSLVDNLLDISKIDAGKVEINNELTDWYGLCEEAISVVRPLAEKNGTRLEFVYSDVCQNMRTDPLRLRQILLNLLSNACKFTRNGKVSLYVKEKAGITGKHIHFTVKDTGIGMSKEQLSKVFFEYEQADRTIGQNYGGTGLGLSICSRLALLLDGIITADSEPGNGSTFTLELPMNTDSPAP